MMSPQKALSKMKTFSASSFVLTSALCFGVLVSCASAKKASVSLPAGAPGQPKAVVPTAPPLEIRKGTMAHAVTSVGSNFSPRFSPDGGKLLFLSASRPSHKQAQIYELDLLRQTERRVTFHDGDDEGASWMGQTKIVYSSVTDEMKEDVSLDRLKSVYENAKTAAQPNGMRPPPRVLNGGEIYEQRLDGREIERMTQQTGPDVSPTASGSRVVFVSSRSGDSKLYLLTEKSTRAITTGLDSAPAFSFDGKSLAWERRLPATTAASASTTSGAPSPAASPTASINAQIFMSDDLKSAVPLTAPGFIDRQPAWNGKGDAVVFSSNRAGKTFDLYSIDRKGSCLKRLTEVQVDLSQPTASPDGSKIAFVAKVNGVNQIFIMDDLSARLPCQAP